MTETSSGYIKCFLFSLFTSLPFSFFSSLFFQIPFKWKVEISRCIYLLLFHLLNVADICFFFFEYREMVSSMRGSISVSTIWFNVSAYIQSTYYNTEHYNKYQYEREKSSLVGMSQNTVISDWFSVSVSSWVIFSRKYIWIVHHFHLFELTFRKNLYVRTIYKWDYWNYTCVKCFWNPLWQNRRATK